MVYYNHLSFLVELMDQIMFYNHNLFQLMLQMVLQVLLLLVLMELLLTVVVLIFVLRLLLVLFIVLTLFEVLLVSTKVFESYVPWLINVWALDNDEAITKSTKKAFLNILYPLLILPVIGLTYSKTSCKINKAKTCVSLNQSKIHTYLY